MLAHARDSKFQAQTHTFPKDLAQIHLFLLCPVRIACNHHFAAPVDFTQKTFLCYAESQGLCG